MFESYKTGMLVGDVANAMQSLYLSLRFAFFAGDKLSVLSRSYDKYLASMVKYSIESAKAAVMNKILINDLTGNTVDPFFVFNGLIPDEHFLLADAKSRNNVLLIENIHQCRFFIAFYNGDYAKAEEIYEVILSFSTSQAPRMLTIQGTFLRGLISFQLYRDGQGEEWQSKGKTLLDKMEPWLQKSKSLFENKVLLLRAEHLASIPNISDAIEMYNASIKSARDHGHIHEEGLAYEFMGNFFASIVESTEATRCYKNAHRCYMIWGAVAKADKIWKDHQLDHFNGIEPRAKHGRD